MAVRATDLLKLTAKRLPIDWQTQSYPAIRIFHQAYVFAEGVIGGIFNHSYGSSGITSLT
jgi:hypothetical protein